MKYSDEVIETCVKLAERYITDREFPDKAFDILDEVGARMQTEVKIPEIIEELKKKASEIKQQKIDVVKKQNYEQAAQLRDKEKKLLDKLDTEKKKFDEEMEKQKQVLHVKENVSTRFDISHITSRFDNDGPILLYVNVGNFETKVVANVSRTRNRICRALNVDSEGLYGKVTEAWRSPGGISSPSRGKGDFAEVGSNSTQP